MRGVTFAHVFFLFFFLFSFFFGVVGRRLVYTINITDVLLPIIPILFCLEMTNEEQVESLKK